MFFFAMPCVDGQTTSGAFGSYRTEITASKDYNKGEAIHEETSLDFATDIRNILHECKGMINEAGIKIGTEYDVELSHHYGIEKFRVTGCTIVNLINREYCKKLIIVLPGQYHPEHRHKLKEETFHLLAGDLHVNLDDIEYELNPGDQLLVERGRWHSFSSKGGAIFEEISTTHFRGDSYYRDSFIDNLDPMQRKTIVESW